MPRVENQGPSVDKFCEETHNGSSTYDVCLDCHSELKDDPNAFNDKLTPYNGEEQGEDGWGGDVMHPDYEGEDPPYDCAVCGKTLTEEDNYA